MHGSTRGRPRRLRLFGAIVVVAAGLAALAAAATTQTGSAAAGEAAPKFSNAVAFDSSMAVRDLPKTGKAPKQSPQPAGNGVTAPDGGYTAVEGDGSAAPRVSMRQNAGAGQAAASAIGAPIANFEGLSNVDNFNAVGFRVNPPDPVGDVGPNHYVEMINLVFAVYSKTGTLLDGPHPIGALWEDFAIEDCTDPSGDPIVLYDQTEDRWLLSQFTTAGGTTDPYYNCVAISKTGDPTGEYYRYAFITQPDTVDGGYFFPDYPKYGVWSNSYIMTTRDFGNHLTNPQYGISVYALEKNKMVNGESKARAVQFFLDSNDVPLNLIGDGLLPPDLDGHRRPQGAAAVAPIVGTQDDNAFYGAPNDRLNVWELSVQWQANPVASLALATQLPVTPFDSIFPCAPTSRDCLPQPGIVDPAQYLDILSYRQRPTYRLAYRNFGKYESLVTSQSVEAAPGVAGMRWYEIRRVDGSYSVRQQGTYAPGDGVHRWMGSIAQDKNGAMGLGYSVVNGTTVFPGIRYTGRVASDPLGTMPQGEGVIINGSGVQTTTNSRWGDYTSMNVDPVDDCTFWYVNEYYQVSGVPLPLPPPPLPPPGTTAPWQTRIASFKLPGC